MSKKGKKAIMLCTWHIKNRLKQDKDLYSKFSVTKCSNVICFDCKKNIVVQTDLL